MGRKAGTSLTWRKDGRWVKKYRGHYFYHPAGIGNKTKSEQEAKEKFRKFKLDVDTKLLSESEASKGELVRWCESEQARILEEYADSFHLRKAWEILDYHREMGREADAAGEAFNDEEVAALKRSATELVGQILRMCVEKSAIGKPVGRVRESSLAWMRDLEEKLPADGYNFQLLGPDVLKKILESITIIKQKPPQKPKGVAPWQELDSVNDKPLTLKKLVEVFLRDQRQQVEMGEISASRYDKLRVVTDKLRLFLTDKLPLENLNNHQLLAWKDEVSRQVVDKEISAVTGRDMLAITKRLIRWAYHREYIEGLPRCITATSKDAFTVKFAPPKIVPADIESIRQLLAKATTDKERLVLFLGINCGYGPRDISGIRKDEIDFKACCLTRCRTKTSKNRNPPVIRYALWPETLEAIRKNLSAGTELAFLTEKGNPLVNEYVGDDGKVKRHDAVHSIWFRLATKAKSKTQLKQLRKTGATLLKQKYPQFVERYLGHSASKISDKHYALEYEQGFAQAIDWLRSEVLGKDKAKAPKKRS